MTLKVCQQIEFPQQIGANKSEGALYTGTENASEKSFFRNIDFQIRASNIFSNLFQL